MTTFWSPKLGDIVWLNYPDAHEPEGRVVGFVAEGYPRAGQPIIERLTDQSPTRLAGLGGWKKGEQVVIAPPFLLPFRFGGPEWQEADAMGLVE